MARSSGRWMGTPASESPACRRTSVFQAPCTGTGWVVRYSPGPVRSSSRTTLPPPCQAVMLRKWASSRPAEVNPIAPPRRRHRSGAPRQPTGANPWEIGSAPAEHRHDHRAGRPARRRCSTRPAAPGRRRAGQRATHEATHRTRRPPRSADRPRRPRAAATRPRGSASTRGSSPTPPPGRPCRSERRRARRAATGDRRAGRRNTSLHQQGLGQIEREVRRRLIPHAARPSRRAVRAPAGSPAAPAARRRARGRRGRSTSPDAGGQRDQDRVEHLAKLGHAEVELALEARERRRETRPPASRGARRKPGSGPSRSGSRPDADTASAVRAIATERGQRAAADQHQVRRAPERHVLAEEPVPEIVERETGEREHTAGAHDHTRRRASTSRCAGRPRPRSGGRLASAALTTPASSTPYSPARIR